MSISRRPRVESRGKVGWRILEKLLDKVDMGHNHAAAAVPAKPELIHGIARNRQ